MTYEALKHFADHRITFEILPAGAAEPVRGEGKVVAIDRDHLSIETEAGEAAGTARYALADVVAVHPA